MEQPSDILDAITADFFPFPALSPRLPPDGGSFEFMQGLPHSITQIALALPRTGFYSVKWGREANSG
jgi:hypothetical protein